MARFKTFVCAVLLVVGAPTAGSAVNPVEHALQTMPVVGDATLVSFTIFTDREEVETHDFRTGQRTLQVIRAPERPTGVRGIGVAGTCNNTNTYEYIRWGSARSARPWRTPETTRFNNAGAPSNASSYWRTQTKNAATTWEDTLNDCGKPDTIAWEMTYGSDTTAALGSTCPAADGINSIGWADLGNGGTLGRACMWSVSGSPGNIFEGEIIFNNNSVVKWCNGACTGGYDLQSVALHEWGHFLGLGHVCGDSDLTACDSANEQAAVMYPSISSNTTQRRLSVGDINGATALYPDAYAFSVTKVTIDNPLPGQKLVPGESYPVTIEAMNTGFKPWPVSSTTTLRRSTSGCSAFVAPEWTACNVPTSLDLDATNQTSTNWPDSSATVIRGEVGRFQAQFLMPHSKAGTTTSEAWVVGVNDGGIVIADGSAATTTFNVGAYAASVVSVVGPYPLGGGLEGTESIIDGVQSSVVVEVRNTGTAPWYLSSGAPRIRPQGGTCSRFAGSDWPSCDDAGPVDENEADAFSDYVLPGEVGRFKFQMSAGSIFDAGDPPPGLYEEIFEIRSSKPAVLGDPVVISFTLI